MKLKDSSPYYWAVIALQSPVGQDCEAAGDVHSRGDELPNAGRQVGTMKANKMLNRADIMMQLFYHFANQQTVLRGIAFSYWGRYFKNINIILYGCIVEMILIYFLLQRNVWDVFIAMPAILGIIIVLLCWRTRSGIVQRIYDLPKSQVAEVLATQPQELRKQIDARFYTNIATPFQIKVENSAPSQRKPAKSVQWAAPLLRKLGVSKVA